MKLCYCSLWYANEEVVLLLILVLALICTLTLKLTPTLYTLHSKTRYRYCRDGTGLPIRSPVTSLDEEPQERLPVSYEDHRFFLILGL